MLPTVAVSVVTREPLSETLTLSAEFRPYQEVRVHAKVAGYVESIPVDIGDHVKAGQALATLEIPELKNDVQHAEARLLASGQDVRRAEANYEEAHLAYSRLAQVLKANPKLVAQQDLESAKAKDHSLESALESARFLVAENKADVDKMHAMLDYASITAPFDGVITKRYADTGALVQAGISSSTQAMPLVDLAEDDRLRLVFPIPESAVSKVHVGLPVEISVDSLPGIIKGIVSRCAGKVDTATRTMEAEIDIPNPDRKYTPGMYASLSIIVERRDNALAVPLQAVGFGTPSTVLVVTKAQKVEERTVTLGLQTAAKAEITSGLAEGELVVVANRAALHSGEKAIGKISDLAAN